jgi:hypothetical protein
VARMIRSLRLPGLVPIPGSFLNSEFFILRSQFSVP